MGGLEGIGWLDWWANPSTNLGGAEITVIVTESTAGLEAHGRLNHDEEREAFQFLCELDPIFTLRFTDDLTIDVTVHPTDDYRQFTLTEYNGPSGRHVEKQFDI